MKSGINFQLTEIFPVLQVHFSCCGEITLFFWPSLYYCLSEPFWIFILNNN